MEFKKYNHSKEEKKISDFWIKKGLFKPKKNKSNKKFSIVIPPPNVTGRLHMGHALNNSLQDVLVRFNRMKGLETLWQPGTDHAGIATQAVVENNLLKEGIKKNDLGREKFIKKIWDWKEESGGIILDQLKKLGCSCDWSRNRFTMDKDLSRAVTKTFVDLYKKKLIYKDIKLVNWDTKLETAISDLEVEQREVQSNLYYIKYGLVEENSHIIIATTRPETMLGDTAVAVNPSDNRYKKFIGKKIKVPIVNRNVKIISDDYVSIDQGSGALKVTPAHDFNDYDIGKRHNLEFINILEKNGKLNSNVPKEFIGLDRFQCRNLIVKILKEKGFLDKIENINNVVPYGDRSNTIIEPFLTEQWGNPSSAYSFGKTVGKAVAEAREKVAALINANPREIIFTSCGTESNNAAINSALTSQPGKRHLITTAVEHSANIKFGESLEKRGCEVTWIPVDRAGQLDVHEIHEAIREDTAVVSVMTANNETGVIYPVEEIAAICRSKGVLFHTDAVQTPGKLKLDVKSMEADYLSLSAHKLHAPKGIGVLYVRKGVSFQPYVMGGEQEQGRRGGTENVASMVAFGKAAEIAMASLDKDLGRIKALRDRMEEGIFNTIEGVSRNGAKEPRLANTSNLSFANCEAGAILLLLDREGICASSGSACTTGSLAPSHVLTAMGLTPELAMGAVRLSLSKYSTDKEIDHLLEKLPEIIAKLRGNPTKKTESATQEAKR